MDKYRTIYQVAVEKWGESSQIDMMIEEMSELTQALLKYKRGFQNIDNVQEEMADVEICMAQMYVIFNTGLWDCVDHQKRAKLRRLETLIRGE